MEQPIGYDTALSEIPPQIVEIAQIGVTYGYAKKHTEPGFMLTNGTVLLESEKDENGFYIGGAGMDGMYIRTPERYAPLQDDKGEIRAFRRMSDYLNVFTGEEQHLIYQYAGNSRENLMNNLAAALRILKASPRVRALFEATVQKLDRIPVPACARLIADIYAAYRGREEPSARERQKAIQKSDNRSRSVER